MSILCQELCYWFSLRMFYFLFTASQEKSRIKRSLQRETSAKVNALSVICPIVIEMCWVELGRIMFSEKKVKNAKMHFERLQNARTATKWSVGFTSVWTFRKGVSCKPLHMALFVHTQMKIIRTAPSQLSPQGGCLWWPCLTLSAPVPSLQETCTFLCPESPAPSKPERLRCLYIYTHSPSSQDVNSSTCVKTFNSVEWEALFYFKSVGRRVCGLANATHSSWTPKSKAYTLRLS